MKLGLTRLVFTESGVQEFVSTFVCVYHHSKDGLIAVFKAAALYRK